MKQILGYIQSGDWFVSVDLKDAYFHYLDDRLVIAQSRDRKPHEQILDHIQSLGLSINGMKSVLKILQDIAFLGLNLDLRIMYQVHVHAQSTCLIQAGEISFSKKFSEVTGTDGATLALAKNLCAMPLE